MDYFALFATIFCACSGIYDIFAMIYNIRHKQWAVALMMFLLFIVMLLCTLMNVKHIYE